MLVSLRLMFAFVATTFLLTSLYIYYDTIHEHVDQISDKLSDVASAKRDSVIFSLVRNEELEGILQSIDHLQTRFNNNFNYDWVFANEVPFTDDFKNTINERFTSGKAIFAEIPKEYWSYQEHIDQEKAATTRKEAKYIYGDSESYRFMCRFNSGYFYKLKELEPYRYYWRVEPNVKFLCNFVEDPFKVMKENGYVYGWTMTMYEFVDTIPTLWDSVKRFIKDKNMNVGEGSNNFMQFLSDDQGNSYNNCHFWSNFEIADLNFFRSQEYEDFFQHLEKDGGFLFIRRRRPPRATLLPYTTLSDLVDATARSRAPRCWRRTGSSGGPR